jgi:hypothetical protein
MPVDYNWQTTGQDKETGLVKTALILSCQLPLFSEGLIKRSLFVTSQLKVESRTIYRPLTTSLNCYCNIDSNIRDLEILGDNVFVKSSLMAYF